MTMYLSDYHEIFICMLPQWMNNNGFGEDFSGVNPLIILSNTSEEY